MKFNEIGNLGLLPETKDEIEVDVTSTIVSDEFKRACASHTQGNYRTAAIRRLVKMGVPFSNEHNIGFEMADKFVKVSCPYCHRNMEGRGGGGNGSDITVRYVCPKCGAEGYLEIPLHGLSFRPKED